MRYFKFQISREITLFVDLNLEHHRQASKYILCVSRFIKNCDQEGEHNNFTGPIHLTVYAFGHI
jgi:hypothetical protein